MHATGVCAHSVAALMLVAALVVLMVVVLLVVVLLVVVLLLLHHPLRGRLVLKSLCLRRISPARRLGLPAAATAAVIAARQRFGACAGLRPRPGCVISGAESS